MILFFIVLEYSPYFPGQYLDIFGLAFGTFKFISDPFQYCRGAFIIHTVSGPYCHYLFFREFLFMSAFDQRQL